MYQKRFSLHYWLCPVRIICSSHTTDDPRLSREQQTEFKAFKIPLLSTVNLFDGKTNAAEFETPSLLSLARATFSLNCIYLFISSISYFNFFVVYFHPRCL